MHAIAYIIFILLFTSWLGYELHRPYRLKTHWIWILAAVVTTLIGIQIFELNKDMLGNLIQHASGGVSCTLLFIYLLKTLKLDFSWRLQTVAVFFFVSTLGVLNELAEYLFEFLGHGPFSVDSHDTWRDLVANTTGALVAWILFTAYTWLGSKKLK